MKNKYKCKFCIDRFKYYYSYLEHMKRFHNYDSNYNYVECPVCQTFLNNESDLEAHLNFAHICFICNQKFCCFFEYLKHLKDIHKIYEF